MENLKSELLGATLEDIKNLVKKYPNDMDLGKMVRTYFRELPEVVKEQMKKFDEKI